MLRRRRARRLPQGQLVAIKSRWSQHPLYIRGGTSDKFVFDQIFLDREYRCLDGLTSVETIIDAGANVGYSAAYLLTRFPEARVICVEPDPSNFEMLKLNLRPFGTRAHLVYGALWSECTTLDFDFNTTEAGQEWGRQVRASVDGQIPAFDIPQLLRMLNIDRIDLLKVDIEGAEEQVFAHDKIHWLDRVHNIVIELHGTEKEKVFMDAISGRYSLSYCDELTVCLAR